MENGSEKPAAQDDQRPPSERDRKPWTRNEIEALVRGERVLPGRDRRSVRNKISDLRKKGAMPPGDMHEWTERELAALKAGATRIRGRTKWAVQRKRSLLRAAGEMPPAKAVKPWTDKEDEALIAGAKKLRGRTVEAVKRRRKLLKQQGRINLPKQDRKPWTEEELLILIQGGRKIEGRTTRAIEHKVTQLIAEGLADRLPAPTAHLLRPGDRPWTKEEDDRLVRGERTIEGRSSHSIACRVTRLAARGRLITKTDPRFDGQPPNPGEIMLEAATRAVPCTLPDDVRSDVIQDVMTAVLYGQITISEIPAYAKKAITAHYRRFPTKYGHRSLDELLFEDGRTTLGETIPSDTFHL